ncbi:MAG: polyamine ABC transporter substrate-binding protein [Bradyrhizobiaceae bacterium]|nr:polyamine ABC transporter substrate-binding protein [Bradyrhizobiaceae bacterium]
MTVRLVRNFLIAILATFAIAALTASARAQDRVVNIYNWSDYIDPKVLEDFTKGTGIKVVYDTFDSNDVVETKMLAGKTGYDVVVPSQTYLQRLISAGVFQKLDKSKLPNLKHAWPEIAKRLATYDPGNEYAVNYMWGTTGIGVNLDRARERLGKVPLNTWDVVFKPEVLAKFADCGVHLLDAPDELIPTALRWLGLNPDSKNTADIEKAGAALMQIRPHVRKFHSSEYINALANGEICLAVGWSGDVLQAKARAEEAAQGTGKGAGKSVNLDYVLPKEGAHMWFDSMAIPKDAPHVAEAHAFIDYMLRPEAAAKNSNAVSYASGNLAAQQFIDRKILDNPSIYPDAETMQRLFISTPYDQKTQRIVTRVWTRVKTGR